jgi:hypothetical protein
MRGRWELSFFAWYVQIFYLCFVCGWWEFSILCVVFAANIFVLNTFLVSIYLFYCNFEDAFCALCVCNKMFLFVSRCLHLSSLCFMRGGWEYSFFAWYLQIFYLCLMCACWEFSVFAWYLQLALFCLICFWWLFTFLL